MLKLSIIVPVFNVAPYLRKCVDSLLAQDYDDYEIILVDDGSTDESGAICEEYFANYQSQITNHKCLIRLIHQANAGLSAARNSGIKIAQGDYLCFVDSDDYWEANVLGKLMVHVEKDKLDVLRFDYQNVNEQYEIFEPYKRSHRLDNDYTEEVTDGVTFLNTRMSTACYAVMYIFRRDLIISEPIGNHQSAISNLQCKELLFTPGIYFEDTDWTPRMLVKAQRVASTNTIVYNYLQREGSITNAVNRAKQKKVLDDKMRLISEMQRQAKELQAKGLNNAWFNRMIADTVISVVGMLSIDFYPERKIYLAQLKQQGIWPLHATNHQSKITNYKLKLINLSPRLAVELLHWRNAK